MGTTVGKWLPICQATGAPKAPDEARPQRSTRSMEIKEMAPERDGLGVAPQALGLSRQVERLDALFALLSSNGNIDAQLEGYVPSLTSSSEPSMPPRGNPSAEKFCWTQRRILSERITLGLEFLADSELQGEEVSHV